jgi:transposase
VLLRYYPAALEVFGHLRSQIGLQFIQAFPTPQAARALSLERLRAFATAQRYTQPRRLPGYLAALQASLPEAAPETVLIYQEEAAFLAEHTLSLRVAKANALRKLTSLFHQHPDAPIFASLPGAGPFLAPALLGFFGEDRARFPSASSIQCLAGTCPVTKESGKGRVVQFRHACDHDFRTVAQQWAKSSLAQSTWANAYWQRVRPRCRSDSHAYRCLANRWLAILWKMWQARQPYDEAYHLQQRAKHTRPRSYTIV